MWIWQYSKWPQFFWDDKVLFKEINKINILQGKLLGNLDIIGHPEELQSELNTLLSNAINTAAIEGENLNVDSVKSSIARRLGIADYNFNIVDPQSEGMAELLLDATRQFHLPLTLSRLYRWHKALFPTRHSGLYAIATGRFRSDAIQVVSGSITKRKVHFEAPPAKSVKSEIQRLIHWFNKESNKLDPLLRAGIAHLWFITIHPFEDGNGRIARALTDLALAQAEHHAIRFYAVSAIIMRKRKTYYEILETTQRNGLDITNWLIWFLSILETSIQDAMTQIQWSVLKARFWQQHNKDGLNERQIKVLNKMLDVGPENLHITARRYMSITKVSKATATRDLMDLQKLQCIKKLDNAGRSTAYVIRLPKPG